jgi:hypothetical protein
VTASRPAPTTPFSDHVVYVDESGDHGLDNMEVTYPMFVLAFCIFRKDEYVQHVVPALQRLKFKHCGHDLVVLHEREMRKQMGPFRFLADRAVRESFMGDVSQFVEQAPFLVIAAVIDKSRLKAQYTVPKNPYHLALGFCLERLQYHLDGGSPPGLVHVIFESRGAREDAELELEFRRLSPSADPAALRFEPIFAAKGSNSTGLQLADLIARPIGRHVMKPDQPNRAYDIIQAKFRRSPRGEVKGWGLKCFP